MAWLTGYKNRRRFVVNGSTDGLQTNYQRLLTIHRGTGEPYPDNLPLLNTLAGVIIVDPKAGGNHAEGCASDGVNLYSSDRFHIYKMDMTGTILITRDDANLDGTAMEQVNGICVLGDYLYVGSSNYNIAPGESYIKVYRKSDLSYITEYPIAAAHWCEGGTWYKGYWWFAYWDWMFISRYDSSFVWQQDYALSQGETTVQGAFTDGNYLFVPTTQPSDAVCVYRWDGVGLVAMGIIPLGIPAPQSGGLEPGGKYFWITDMIIMEVDGNICQYAIDYNNLYADCKADFSDIRFTTSDGLTLLDYWIENITGNTALVWVEFDSIPASPGTAEFFLYWGNPAAVDNSNGPATFIAFDDFERGINGDPIGGAWTVTTGVAQISTDHPWGGTRCAKLVADAAGTRITIPRAVGTDFAIRVRIYKEDATTGFYPFMHGDGVDQFGTRINNNESEDYSDGGFVASGFFLTPDIWVLQEINNLNHTTNKFDWYEEGVPLKLGAGVNVGAGWANVYGVASLDVAAGHDAYIDNVIIRQWTQNEPWINPWYGAESIGKSHGAINNKLIAAGVI
jgi:hypothetical protein